MRRVYDASRVNIPRTIAGIEWRLVVAVLLFFGMAALMFRELALLVPPLIIFAFLHGPGKRDPFFLDVYRRHAAQRDFYSPAYISKPNLRNPRPLGFSRFDTV